MINLYNLTKQDVRLENVYGRFSTFVADTIT